MSHEIFLKIDMLSVNSFVFFGRSKHGSFIPKTDNGLGGSG